MIIVVSISFLFIGDLLVSVLGLPAHMVGVFFFVSLFGSYLNLPIATLESRVPIVQIKEVNAFGVKWHMPSIRVRIKKTQIMINAGGAILPLVVTGYLLSMPLIQA